MSDLDLRFIGSGNAFAPGGLCWNGFVVNERYLFEAPPQALMALNRLQIDPNALEAIVLSHQHGDHTFGLPFLLLHFEYMGRTRPIRIIAPAEAAIAIRQACDLAYPGVIADSSKYGIEWITPAPGETVRVSEMELRALSMKHDPKLAECFGYDCRLAGRRLGYTGDTALCDSVFELARASEVLVSECSSRAESIPVHMNLRDDMPKVRARMRPDAHLVLTHINADVDAGGLQRTVVAKDFETLRF